jgi:type II secretory pathway pseudopilin PulG
MIEMVCAMALFAVVITPLGGIMTASLAAQTGSKERTLAQQAAQSAVEAIRGMPYDDVGLTTANPAGRLVGQQAITLQGLKATLGTEITYVNDPVSPDYATYADYKKVVVTVTRTRDARQLAREVTYVAPPAGTGTARIIKVQVVDYALRSVLENATVSLATGPSAPRIDRTDPTGWVVFPDLTPNPSSGSQSYYDINVSATGYQTLRDDLPPASQAHVRLVDGQTFTTVLQVYKPATIYLQVRNTTGTPYAGTAPVTVSSSRGSQTFNVTGGSATVTQVAGEPVVPGIQYTVTTTAGGQFAGIANQTVPNNYPVDLTSTFPLTLQTYTTRTLTVRVQRTSGSSVSGAAVTVLDGPVPVRLTGTTNGSGNVTFTVPTGTAYRVTATSGSLSGGWTGDVNSNSNVAVTVS